MKAIMKTKEVVAWLKAEYYPAAAGIVEEIFTNELVETKDLKLILTAYAFRNLECDVPTFVPDFKFK